MKGFAYTEKDRVVVNTEKKPRTEDFVIPITDDNLKLKYWHDQDSFNETLSAWNDSCYVVENAEKWIPKENLIYIRFGDEPYSIVKSAQPVHFDITGEKTAKITSINN